MSSHPPNTIKLIFHGRFEEYPANAALKPGHVLSLNADGEVLKSTSGGDGDAPLLVAWEDALQGKTIDDAYAAGDVVFTLLPIAGDVLLLRVAAAAAAILNNDSLVFAGDGTVKKAVGSPVDVLFANTADSTPIVAADTNPAAYDVSYTMPANSLQVGDLIHLRGSVKVLDQNSTNTLIVTVKIGATVIAATAAIVVADNDLATWDLYLHIRTVGATGTFTANGEIGLGVPGTATMRVVGLGSTVIDTTATQAITVTQTWSAAHADNEAQLVGLSVEKGRSNEQRPRFAALEALDNSAGASEAFIKARVLN